MDLKKGKDRNEKTSLNPSKDVKDQRYLIKQRRKTFEKLNFCIIKDLQLKLSTSKATSATVQTVHPNLARGIRKSPAKLILSA